MFKVFQFCEYLILLQNLKWFILFDQTNFLPTFQSTYLLTELGTTQCWILLPTYYWTKLLVFTSAFIFAANIRILNNLILLQIGCKVPLYMASNCEILLRQGYCLAWELGSTLCSNTITIQHTPCTHPQAILWHLDFSKAKKWIRMRKNHWDNC